jgi:hypothetical protein
MIEPSKWVGTRQGDQRLEGPKVAIGCGPSRVNHALVDGFMGGHFRVKERLLLAWR